MTKSVMIIKNTYTFYTNFKGGIMKHMSYKIEPYIYIYIFFFLPLFYQEIIPLRFKISFSRESWPRQQNKVPY